MWKWRTATVLSAIAAVCLLSTSCTTAVFTSTSFEPVFEGRYLPEPVDLNKLRSAIRSALATFNWRTTSETASSFSAEFQKSEGVVRAVIKVVYTSSGYRIEYVESRGLDADLAHKTIHRNYVRWMLNLDKQIYTNYYQ